MNRHRSQTPNNNKNTKLRKPNTYKTKAKQHNTKLRKPTTTK